MQGEIKVSKLKLFWFPSSIIWLNLTNDVSKLNLLVVAIFLGSPHSQSTLHPIFPVIRIFPMTTSLLCIQYSYIPPLFAPVLSSSLFKSPCIHFSYHGLSLLLEVYYLRTQKSIVSDWWPRLCINFHINLFSQPVPLEAVFSLSVLKIGSVNEKEYPLVLPAAWGKEFDKYLD